MSPEKQREIASKGGRAAHEKGTAHEWTADEARTAGRKGGQVSRGGRGRLVVPPQPIVVRRREQPAVRRRETAVGNGEQSPDGNSRIVERKFVPLDRVTSGGDKQWQDA